MIISVVRGNDDNLRGESRPPSSEKLAAEKVSLELKGAERLWEKPFVGIPQTAIRKPLILTNISSALNTLAGKLYCRTKQSVAPNSRAQSQKNKWCHHWCWNWEEFLISQYWHLYWWKDKIWIRWIWSEALSSDSESQLTISYKSIGIVWAYNPTWQNLWTTLQIHLWEAFITCQNFSIE